MMQFFGVGEVEEPVEIVKEIDVQLKPFKMMAVFEVIDLIDVVSFTVDNSNQESE